MHFLTFSCSAMSPVKDDALCDLEVVKDELLKELPVHVGPASLEI